jgi:hypothetical protein
MEICIFDKVVRSCWTPKEFSLLSKPRKVIMSQLGRRSEDKIDSCPKICSGLLTNIERNLAQNKFI